MHNEDHTHEADQPSGCSSKFSFEVLAGRLKDEKSSAQQQVYQRYVYQLVRLASSKISRRFNGKIDPEDVVQSVFSSFFSRYQADKVDPQNWNELWSLLATMTVRKCLRDVKKFSTEKRAVLREVAMFGRNQGSTCCPGIEDVQPSIEEQVVFEETFSRLLEPLTDLQKQIVAFKLSGYSKTEISKAIGRSERTVHRAFVCIRQQLEFLCIEDGHVD